MKNGKENTSITRLGLKIMFGIFLLIIAMWASAFLLDGTKYTKVAVMLALIIWLVLLVFIGKYFVRFVQSFFE